MFKACSIIHRHIQVKNEINGYTQAILIKARSLTLPKGPRQIMNLSPFGLLLQHHIPYEWGLCGAFTNLFSLNIPPVLFLVKHMVPKSGMIFQ